MKRRINLLLVGVLLGGIAATLPTLGKISVFTGIALVLFMSYDEWAYRYDHRNVGGAE